MATQTPNYGYHQFEMPDLFDPIDLNPTFQKIDTDMKRAEDAAGTKQPKEPGKGLSANDYTDTDKAKLATAATLGADGKLLDGQVPGADKVPLTVEGMAGTVQAGIAELQSGKMGMPTEIPNSADLNDYITPGLFYNGTSSGKIINLPVLSHAFSLLVEKTYAFHFGIKQTLTDYFNGATYLRTNYVDVTGTWRPWVQLATATPPQEYVLPLAAGITDGPNDQAIKPPVQSKYYKDQFGYVHVHGALSGTFVWDTAVAAMPEGFRPASFMEFSATFFGTNNASSASGCVNSDAAGVIRAFPPHGVTCARVFFDCRYRAAN